MWLIMSINVFVILVVFSLIESNVLCQINNNLIRNDNKNIDNLKYSSLLYGLLVSTSEQDVNTTCYEHLQRIIQGIKSKETWAMKVFDASGNIEVGFILGNNHWLGSQATCDSVDKPFRISMSNRFERNTVKDLLDTKSPINLEYRLVYAKHASPWQIDMIVFQEHVLHIGLCLPLQCSDSEVYSMMRVYFQNNIEVPQFVALKIQPQIMEVKNMRLRDGFFRKKTVLAFSLLLLLCIGVACAAYIIERKEIESAKKSPEQKIPDVTTTASQNETCSKISITKRLVLHFSLKRNLTWLYDTTKPTQSITIIFGMKSLACFLILAFHTQWYSYFSLTNPYQLYHYTEQRQNKFIVNAPVLVDLFFVVSGFLMTYNFLSDKQQMEAIKVNGLWANFKHFGKMVLQRYLRLALLYFIVILVVEIFSSYVVDTSYFYMMEKYDLNCQRYWWRNVLFIQNFFEFDEMCLTWSWSLACELQYFILFLAILFIYVKNKKLGLIFYFTLFGTIVVLLIYILSTLNYVQSYDVASANIQYVYINSFTRMSAYFPGVAGGWIYATYKGQSPVSMKFLRFTAILSTFIMVATLNSTLDRNGLGNVWANTAIYSVGRWIYPISFMSLILVTTFGYQNTLTRFFSAKVFVHISKLEYAIYLLNPLVVIVLCGLSNSSRMSDSVMVLNLVLSVAVITYILAVLFTVLFELPFSKLLNEVFKKKAAEMNCKKNLQM